MIFSTVEYIRICASGWWSCTICSHYPIWAGSWLTSCIAVQAVSESVDPNQRVIQHAQCSFTKHVTLANWGRLHFHSKSHPHHPSAESKLLFISKVHSLPLILSPKGGAIHTPKGPNCSNFLNLTYVPASIFLLIVRFYIIWLVSL